MITIGMARVDGEVERMRSCQERRDGAFAEGRPILFPMEPPLADDLRLLHQRARG